MAHYRGVVSCCRVGSSLIGVRQASWTSNKIFATLAIFNFLAVIFYLNSSLNEAVEELPDDALDGSESSFCPPFNSSLTDEESRRNIFFLETSGEKCLTPRQACSIESAARMNPHMNVILHVDSGSFSSRTNGSTARHRADTLGNRRNCDVMDILKSFSNIQIVRSRLVDELRDTFFWDRWYSKGRLDESLYPHVHLSDAVRVAILHKRGGIYLDLDCIVLRPIDCLRNTAGYLKSLPSWIENGVLSFDKSHPFLNFLMKVMVQYYKPAMRESMGPPSLAFALKFYCTIGLNASFQHAAPYECHDGASIHLQPPESFYAIQSASSRKFVEPQIDRVALKGLSKSYLSHIYFHTKHKVPLSSLYATLARKYCPAVYRVLKQDF